MNQARALAAGFTHHGKMFSVPCWLSNPYGPSPMIEPKVAALGYWIDFCCYVVQFANMLGADWDFPILIGSPIAARTGDAE